MACMSKQTILVESRSKRYLENLFADRKRVVVVLSWLIIAASSVPFERINDDEAIFFVEARRMLVLGPHAHRDLIFVPQILGAIVSEIYNSLLAARVVSAVAVLVTAILIYSIKKDDSTFISSMLYLTSFYTIRFGLRFYLDPFGGFFTIAAIYFLYKEKSHFVGIYSAIAIFSREMAAPLFPIFAALVYRRKLGMKKFLCGFIPITLLGVIWIYLATKGIQSAIITNTSEVTFSSYLGISSIYSILEGWIQYALISPLVLIGILIERGGRRRPEFFVMVFSFLILSFVPGFVINGAATQYPYIFNTVACITAGSGLNTLYQRFSSHRKGIIRIVVLVLVIQFAVQSYFATALTINNTIGVQDYGYWHDQELLSYMNKHYHGGKIYSSTYDVFLDLTLAPNSKWLPQNITLALFDNPEWLITYKSYVIVKSVPANVTIVDIGPYLVIDRGQVPLSSFIELNNSTQFFR